MKITENVFKMAVVAMLVALSAIFTACGDDAPSAGGSANGDGTGGGGFGGNDKEYLEETARMFMSYFNEADQDALVRTLGRLQRLFEDNDLPSNFTEGTTTSYLNAFRNMTRSYSQNKLYGMSRSTVSYIYSMSTLRGVYELNTRRGEWEKTAQSNNVEFRCNIDGDQVVITLKGEGGEWSTDFEVEDEYYDYDYDYGYGQWYTEYEHYYLTIPKTATLTLKRGGRALLTAIVKSDFVDGSRASVNADITAMNIGVKLDVNGTQTQVTETQTLSVNNSVILKSNATVKGRGMCSESTWKNKDLDEILTSGDCTAEVLNRITVKGKITDARTFCQYVDYYVDSYESADPASDARLAAQKINNSVDGKLYYNNGSQVRATISWRAYQDYGYFSDYYNQYIEEWSIEPMITFTCDGTPYTFERYFGSGNFASVENQFENILDFYERAFNNR